MDYALRPFLISKGHYTSKGTIVLKALF